MAVASRPRGLRVAPGTPAHAGVPEPAAFAVTMATGVLSILAMHAARRRARGALRARRGAGRPKLGQLALSVLDDPQAALRAAHERFRFSAQGWKVMAELPNPVNFEAATSVVREEDVAQSVPCGPDPEAHLEAIRRWIDAGFDCIAIVQVPDDQEAFFELWERELAPALRQE